MVLEAVNVRSERPQGPMITPRTDMEGELLTNRCGDVCPSTAPASVANDYLHGCSDLATAFPSGQAGV